MIPLLLLLGILVSPSADAQQAALTGTVVDLSTRAPLRGAYIALGNTKDSTSTRVGTTDQAGRFRLTNIQPGTYQLEVSFVGYQEILKELLVAQISSDLDTLALTPIPIPTAEVVVAATMPPVEQLGDTLQFNARAFKLQEGAMVEDLVARLPGVVAQNDAVVAQGETVTQVLVDKKRFFGDDPMIALRNLPAEVVDKIQVYDQLSDQSELTGFNDGQTTKTINIVTRPDRRRGRFGREMGALGDADRYATLGNINLAQDTRRITFIGQSNNINQQNFSTQDVLGAMGGGIGGGGGGRGGGSRGGGDAVEGAVGPGAGAEQQGLRATTPWVGRAASIPPTPSGASTRTNGRPGSMWTEAISSTAPIAIGIN